MKTLFKIIIAVVIIQFSSCNKEISNQSNGTVTAGHQSEGSINGLNQGACMCCGGWMININNKQYEFLSLPANSTINLNNETFPLKVVVDWKLVPAGCYPNLITLESIKKE
jgi:hypothetical protein